MLAAMPSKSDTVMCWTRWLNHQHAPISISTDDVLLFNTPAKPSDQFPAAIGQCSQQSKYIFWERPERHVSQLKKRSIFHVFALINSTLPGPYSIPFHRALRRSESVRSGMYHNWKNDRFFMFSRWSIQLCQVQCEVFCSQTIFFNV